MAKNKDRSSRALAAASSTWTEEIDADTFLEKFPPMRGVRRATDADFTVGDRLPTTLRKFLTDVGFGRFGEGFLRTIPPHQLDPLLDEWLGGHNPTRVPFATTAMGDILYFRDLRDSAGEPGLNVNDIFVVDVAYKRTVMLAEDLSVFLVMLTSDAVLTEVLSKDLFDAARPRLGPPAIDEVYGFVPALALGGSRDAANLHCLKADVHLAILLQC